MRNGGRVRSTIPRNKHIFNVHIIHFAIDYQRLDDSRNFLNKKFYTHFPSNIVHTKDTYIHLKSFFLVGVVVYFSLNCQSGGRMIPITLEISNFLSYGPCPKTIHFGSYKLICLSGKNGHGKSALLDAITWALWGQARKTGSTVKPDDGLLRVGQTEMSVTLDFLFNALLYRIQRLYSKKYGKPHTHVEFGMVNPATEKFISLTEKTQRLTQHAIEKTIGIDYEAFINSSFLRQGQANEFSKKSPKERKEILTSILGFQHFDKTRALCLEKIRATQIKRDTMVAMQHVLEKQMAELALYQEQLAVVHTELSTCGLQQTEIQQQRTHLCVQYDALKQKKQNLAREQQDR